MEEEGGKREEGEGQVLEGGRPIDAMGSKSANLVRVSTLKFITELTRWQCNSFNNVRAQEPRITVQ
jgi:hypothetical protein